MGVKKCFSENEVETEGKSEKELLMNCSLLSERGVGDDVPPSLNPRFFMSTTQVSLCCRDTQSLEGHKWSVVYKRQC